MHHLANTLQYKLLYSSNEHMSAAQWCPSSFPSGPSWVYHEVVSDMPVWHERNTWGVGCLESIITMHLYANMKLKHKKGFNSCFNSAEGLFNPLHSNFYGGNNIQRTVKDSNMVLRTFLLPHNQSCNTWTEMKCLVTPSLLIPEEMWSGECKHHVFNEGQHWWIVDEIACSHH